MKNLKLTSLNPSLLSDVEMSQAKGGQMSKGNCACACKYAQSGGSSTSGNGNANNKDGLHSPGTKPSSPLEIKDRTGAYTFIWG